MNPAFRFGVSQPLGDAAISEAVQVAKESETVLLCVGRSGEWDTEGSDLDHIQLPGRQDELVKAVGAVNPNTIVVLQTGGPVEMPWLDDVAAVLQLWYPGQELGNALADIVFGDVEPTGRLPQTFPKTWSDNPAHSEDPRVYPGKDGDVCYEEGVFIGYRHYDAKKVEPMFPFGHGLGYTQFAIEGMTVSESQDGVAANVLVRNSGQRMGTTVVQLYVGDDEASLARPDKELKGYAKIVLEAGECRTVSIPLSGRDFAYFDVEAGLWRVEAGIFTLSAGLSASDIQASTKVARKAEEIRR